MFKLLFFIISKISICKPIAKFVIPLASLVKKKKKRFLKKKKTTINIYIYIYIIL